MTTKLSELGKEQNQKIGQRLHFVEQKRESILARDRCERADLKSFHEKRQLEEW